MAYEVSSMTVDLQQDRTTVTLTDHETGTWVSVNVRLATPGNQPENRLKDLARQAARDALQAAVAAL